MIKIVRIVLNKELKILSVNKLSYLVILSFFCCLLSAYSQVDVIGTVTDKEQNGIPYATITITKDSLPSIIAYTITDKEGKYRISIKEKGNHTLTFASLGYKSELRNIEILKAKDTLINIIMEEEAISLSEVIIRADPPIRTKKDTVIFNADYFLTGTEQVVEDLLGKIPGISISEDGSIKVQGIEIEKLMVDGDDLFESGYRILSKSMPVRPIKRVEVLHKFSNNKLLKDIEHSNKVAINLTLKEDFKRVWFGNFDVGYSPENKHYQTRFNLANFGKKNKYYFIGNLNNTGDDATGDIQRLIKPYRDKDEPGSIGDNESVSTLINLSADELNFDRRRTNFNNEKLISLNSVFNPTEKLQIKPFLFLNTDHTNFYRDMQTSVNVPDAEFVNIETYHLQNKKRIGFGKIDLIYDLTPTQMLEATTKYNYNSFDDHSDLMFNANATLENLEHKSRFIDQKISYTNKLDKNKVVLLTSRFINEKRPQNYHIDQFFYQELFPDSEQANNIEQKTDAAMQYAGINTHFLNRTKNKNLVEFQIGNEYRKDKIFSKLSLLEDKTVINIPEGFQNQTYYQVNDLYLKSSYRLIMGNLALAGKLDVHQLFTKLDIQNEITNQNPFYVHPRLSLDWEIDDNNKITTSYSYNKTNTKVVDMHSGYILNGVRSFNKGTSRIDQLQASQVFINYTLGDWSDRFFVNTFLIYGKNHNFLSTNSTIRQNYVLSEKILIKDRSFLSLNTNLDYYIKHFKTNVKLDLGFQESTYKNVVNLSLQEVRSRSYNYGLELRSAFIGVFNYHIGTKWSTSEIKTEQRKTFTNQLSFLNLSLAFTNGLTVQLESEQYHFGSLESNKGFYFLDMYARYSIPNSKLDFAIEARNLLDTKTFTTYSVNDISITIAEYRLLPRMVLLKATYRL